MQKRFDVWATDTGKGLVEIVAKEVDGNNYVTSVVSRAKVDSKDKMAQWIVNQPAGTWQSDSALQKRLTITYTQNDGRREVSNTEAEDMPSKQSETALLALPHLGVATDAQIETYITNNILTAVDVIEYLKELSAAVVHLRDLAVALRESVRISGSED